MLEKKTALEDKLNNLRREIIGGSRELKQLRAGQQSAARRPQKNTKGGPKVEAALEEPNVGMEAEAS